MDRTRLLLAIVLVAACTKPHDEALTRATPVPVDAAAVGGTDAGLAPAPPDAAGSIPSPDGAPPGAGGSCGQCAHPAGTAEPTCSADHCVYRCLEGFQACTGVAERGCLDLRGSPDNCGECGHTCNGDRCSDGRCETTVFASGLGPGLVGARPAYDGSSIFYGDAMGISAVGQSGSTLMPASPSVVAVPLPGPPRVLAVFGEYAYWSDSTSSGVRIARNRLNYGGATVETLVIFPAKATVVPFAVVPGFLYWYRLEDGAFSIQRVALDKPGATAETLVSSPNTTAHYPLVTATDVFWLKDGPTFEIQRVSLVGEPPSVLYHDPAAADPIAALLAADEFFVYWSTGHQILRKPIMTNHDPPTVIGETPAPATGIPVLGPDKLYVFGLDGDGRVLAVSRQGLVPARIVAGKAGPGILSAAASNRRLYWLDRDGTMWWSAL